MKKLILAVTLTLFSLSALAWSAPSALAEERSCNGTARSSYDNVRVPRGATCTMNGTYTKGNIVVEPGGTLRADRIRVIGAIYSSGGRSVAVTNSSINGNIQHEAGGKITIRANVVGESIQLKTNSGSGKTVYGNRVGQDIQLFNNCAGTDVSRNTVNGNLQCKSNGSPFTGSGNRVYGNKQDQCARF
jgi:hypothetical protein